jgi:AraC-like DNA-binding protein
MDFRLPAADRAARGEALAELALRLSLAPWGTSGRVRHALRSLMLSGRTKLPDVAAHLGHHPKALRRALAREGTTFDAVKDDVRHAVARELLTLTPLPVGDIAMTLNFASPSSFVHAFRRWSGSSPARWRKLPAS